MSIIESVTEFISTCPYLSEMAAIYTDYTDSEPDNYGVADYGEGDPISTYMDGSMVCQHNFALYFFRYIHGEKVNLHDKNGNLTTKKYQYNIKWQEKEKPQNGVQQPPQLHK